MSRKSRSTSFLHIYGVNLRVYHLNGFQKLVVSLCLSLPTIVSLGSVISCDRESGRIDDHQSYYKSGCWGSRQWARDLEKKKTWLLCECEGSVFHALPSE